MRVVHESSTDNRADDIASDDIAGPVLIEIHPAEAGHRRCRTIDLRLAKRLGVFAAPALVTRTARVETHTTTW